jgi:hypothetical protein
MKIYLAARFDRLPEMNQYAEELRKIGHTVDCRWLNGSHQLHPGAELIDRPKGLHEGDGDVPMLAQPFAIDDHEDLINSDAIILFTEPPNSYSKRGGRHVEFGIAPGLGKELIIVGFRENVFHCLPQVKQYRTWEECLEGLKL